MAAGPVAGVVAMGTGGIAGGSTGISECAGGIGAMGAGEWEGAGGSGRGLDGWEKERIRVLGAARDGVGANWKEEDEPGTRLDEVETVRGRRVRAKGAGDKVLRTGIRDGELNCWLERATRVAKGIEFSGESREVKEPGMDCAMGRGVEVRSEEALSMESGMVELLDEDSGWRLVEGSRDDCSDSEYFLVNFPDGSLGGWLDGLGI